MAGESHRTPDGVPPLQYLALTGFVIAQSLIFVSLLYVAQHFAGGGVIESAAWVTLLGFAGLTGIVFYTRKDFSLLRTVLMWGGFAALGLIVAGSVFGFQLGTFFSVGMVAFAGRPFSTTPPTSCITTPKTGTSQRRWSCSRQ